MLRNFGGFRVRRPRSYPDQEQLPAAPSSKSKRTKKRRGKAKKQPPPLKPSKLYYARLALEAELDAQPRKRRERFRLIKKIEGPHSNSRLARPSRLRSSRPGT
jgi:hypothetical protein